MQNIFIQKKKLSLINLAELLRQFYLWVLLLLFDQDNV